MSDYNPLTEMRFLTSDIQKALTSLPSDKATKQALRRAARVLVREAKAWAPVGPEDDIHRGALKRSIHQSKRITRRGLGSYSVSVGPIARGRVQLYRAKMEEEHLYMYRGYQMASQGRMAEEFERTFTSVIKRGR